MWLGSLSRFFNCNKAIICHGFLTGKEESKERNGVTSAYITDFYVIANFQMAPACEKL